MPQNCPSSENLIEAQFSGHNALLLHVLNSVNLPKRSAKLLQNSHIRYELVYRFAEGAGSIVDGRGQDSGCGRHGQGLIHDKCLKILSPSILARTRAVRKLTSSNQQ